MYEVLKLQWICHSRVLTVVQIISDIMPDVMEAYSQFDDLSRVFYLPHPYKQQFFNFYDKFPWLLFYSLIPRCLSIPA